MPSGNTSHLFKQKLRSKWYRRQKLESVTAMGQKAILDVVQEISDDSEIIAHLKETHLIEREILHCRWKRKDPGIESLTSIDSLDLFASIFSGIYLSFNWAIISLSSKTAFYIIAVMIQAYSFYTVCFAAFV